MRDRRICANNVEGCGELRMRSNRSAEGLDVSFSLSYCATCSTEQVEQAAKALIVSVGELAGVFNRAR